MTTALRKKFQLGLIGNLLKYSLVLTCFISAFATRTWAADIRELPVQDSGRIKALDSFARESLELIYGKQQFESRPAYEVVLTWSLMPEAWRDRKIFEVKNHDILKRLSLSTDQRYFTGEELVKNGELERLVGDLEEKRKIKEKLNPYFQDVQRIESQLITFREIAAGRAIRVMPNTDSSTANSWKSLSELNPEEQNAFMPIVKNFVSYLGTVTGAQSLDPSARKNALLAVSESVDQFMNYAKSKNPQYNYATSTRVEVIYNNAHPFRIAYLLYLTGAMILLVLWITNQKKGVQWAWIAALAGLIFHIAGFSMRVYLTGRAPVSNMYETVVWVAFGAILFAMIFEAIYKTKFYLLTGSLVGFIALVVADMAPAILDPTLHPLEPVLRSNYWLTIHVMTITISYAAFFLAFGLGVFGLIYVIKGDDLHSQQVRALVMGVYRAIQTGVSFLAPGIILGGIWADYSWGRFWGWDPKETWALIVLLGYIALLHARLVGWVKNFGMLISAVLGFLLVIMAWYGVNFVLGAGLHSYGFGAGGIEYVSVFVALCFILVAIAWKAHHKANGMRTTQG